MVYCRNMFYRYFINLPIKNVLMDYWKRPYLIIQVAQPGVSWYIVEICFIGI